jgi:hypothetical protein
MSRLATSQISPGAETCVLVGGADGLENVDLRGYRSVLWFAREAAAARAPAGLDPQRTTVEAVDRLDPQRTMESLDHLIQRDALHLPSVFVTDEVTGESAPAYQPVIEAIFAQFERHQRARLTRQQDGFLWQRHVLGNLSAYAHRRVSRYWAGALDGVPAFICGAGPSLDASLPALAPFAEGGVIFAADSALRALARANVCADFLVTVDPNKTPERCLVPGHPSAGRVIAASASPPDWQYSVAEQKLHYLSGKQLTEDALTAFGVKKTGVAVEENCGITALALALHLGCGPVYFFGMDHAVDAQAPGRWHQRHADPACYQGNGFQAAHAYPRVPGNFQDEIATPLYREWRRLDALCGGLPAGLVFNVTDRGARLSNTTVVRPEAFAPAVPAADKAARLSLLAAPQAVRASEWRRMQLALAGLAGRAAAAIDDARRALRAGDAAKVAGHLAGIFQRKEFSLLFGNYSLRILPHLLRPAETTPAMWEQLLHECAELVALAETVR